MGQQPQIDPVEYLKIQRDGHVVTVTLCGPPHYHVDEDPISKLATAFGNFDEDLECRALVLAAEGKSFCVGQDFIDVATRDSTTPARIHAHAGRSFARANRWPRRFTDRQSSAPAVWLWRRIFV